MRLYQRAICYRACICVFGDLLISSNQLSNSTETVTDKHELLNITDIYLLSNSFQRISIDSIYVCMYI